MYDAFHFREDSSQRKKLTEHIGHHMRVLIAEHIASKVPESRSPEVSLFGHAGIWSCRTYGRL